MPGAAHPVVSGLVYCFCALNFSLGRQYYAAAGDKNERLTMLMVFLQSVPWLEERYWYWQQSQAAPAAEGRRQGQGQGWRLVPLVVKRRRQ